MKTILILLLSSLIAGTVIAQNTVTINIKGNRNQQVIVDGEVYAIENYSSTSERAPIVIPDLEAGRHSLKLVRSRGNTGNTVASTKYFDIRPGYDMEITINANGTITTREIREQRWGNALGETAMSPSAFSRLYRDVQSVSQQSRRVSIVSDAFARDNNYFTAYQARQLLQLISSESQRLTLAKAAYHTIVDPENVDQLYSVLNSRASKNALEAYVTANTFDSDVVNHNQNRSPISDAQFNTIYTNAENQWQANLRLNYITDFFANAQNFFTTTQASQLIQLITGENNRLILAKTAYRGITDPENFTDLYDLFNSQNSRNQLTAYVNAYLQSDNTGSVRTPMTESEFNSIYRRIQNTWGSGAKMNSLRDLFASSSYWFTTSQARQLILLVSPESQRLELAKAAYNNVTDPANFHTVYDILPSQSARNELSAYVRSQGGSDYGYQYRTPMPDSEFSTLYNQVRNTWGFGAKMNSLSNIFANTSYWFTTEQAKQLIQLVSAESNRLELAKASYDNITDPANFNRIHELLASQSSRNELDAFVRNQGNADAGNGGSIRTPMSDSEYNTLYRSVQNTWGFGAKMNSLTTIFANNSYSFTTAQAKRLIELVSSESNRLQLAKASYDNITDLNNFSQLYDVLESQSSRDELTAYVNSISYR